MSRTSSASSASPTPSVDQAPLPSGPALDAASQAPQASQASEELRLLLQSLGSPYLPENGNPLGRNDFCIPEFSRATLSDAGVAEIKTLSNVGVAEIKFSSQEEAEAFKRRLLGLRVDDEKNPLGKARVCPFLQNNVSVDEIQAATSGGASIKKPKEFSVKIAGIPIDKAGLENLLERIRDSDQAREFAKRDVERRLDQTTRSVTFISSAGIIPALRAGVGTLFAGLHRVLHPWCPGSAVVGSIASVACRSAARNFESVGHSLPQKSREAFYRGARGLNSIAESVEEREKYFADDNERSGRVANRLSAISTSVGAVVYSPMIAVGAATAGVAIAFNGVADPMLNAAKRIRESANQSARDGNKVSAFFKRVGAGILTGLAVPFRIVGAIAEKTTDLSLSIAGADRYQSGSFGFASKIGDAARKIRNTMHSLRISASSPIKVDDKVTISATATSDNLGLGVVKTGALTAPLASQSSERQPSEQQLVSFGSLKQEAISLARRIKNPKFENSSGIPGDNKKYLRVTTIALGTDVDQRKYELLVAIDGTVKVVDSRRGASALRQEGNDVHPDCDIKEFCKRASASIKKSDSAIANSGMSIAQFEQHCRTSVQTFDFLKKLKVFQSNDGRTEYEVDGYVVKFKGEAEGEKEVVCYKKGHPNQLLSTCADKRVSLEFFNFVAGLVEKGKVTLGELPRAGISPRGARSASEMAAAAGRVYSSM